MVSNNKCFGCNLGFDYEGKRNRFGFSYRGGDVVTLYNDNQVLI